MGKAHAAQDSTNRALDVSKAKALCGFICLSVYPHLVCLV